MDNLNINLGDHIKVRTVDLIDGKFVKLQPQTKDFLDISNPKAVYVHLIDSINSSSVWKMYYEIIQHWVLVKLFEFIILEKIIL